MRLILLVAAATTLAASGCGHHQLRRSMVGQSGIVADLYQQQVLDNLARFVRDPNALPYFAVPGKGYTEVTDSTAAGGGLGWDFTRFAEASISAGGDSQIEMNYELLPVSDPRKLELIRCALQKAVAGYRPTDDCCCPNCEQRFNKFYTGKTTDDVSAKTAEGIVTSDCLSSCWFKVGCTDCKEKLLRDNPCCLVGEYCGTVIWTCPGMGSDELAKLTIAILDYATNDPPVVATKTRTVVAFRDAAGNPTNAADAAYQISGEVDVDEKIEAILYGIPEPVVSEDGENKQSTYSTEGGPGKATRAIQNKISKPEKTLREVVPARRSPEMLPSMGLPRFEFERLN